MCDGQSNIAYRILYGGVLDGIDWFTKTISLFKKELELLSITEGNVLPLNFFQSFTNSKSQELLKNKRKDVKLNKLQNLSLQQATDLAYLLLKVERDFQAYTEDIPTVGGHIKLAVIGDNGIRYILGEEIIKPTEHL